MPRALLSTSYVESKRSGCCRCVRIRETTSAHARVVLFVPPSAHVTRSAEHVLRREQAVWLLSLYQNPRNNIGTRTGRVVCSAVRTCHALCWARLTWKASGPAAVAVSESGKQSSEAVGSRIQSGVGFRIPYCQTTQTFRVSGHFISCFWNIDPLKDVVPVTVDERSKAWTVFARSEAGIVSSNPTQGINV
jgi:hypothetical protein